MVETLLRAGAHPQQPDGRGRNALDLALEGGQFLVCCRLLDAWCTLTAPPAADADAGGQQPAGEAAAEEGADAMAAGAGSQPGSPAAAAVEQGAEWPAAGRPSVECMLRWLGGEGGAPDDATLGALSGDERVGYPWPGRVAPPTLLECAARAGKLDLLAALLAKRAEQAQQEGGGASAGAAAAMGTAADAGLLGRVLAAAVRGGSLGVAGWLLAQASGPEAAEELLRAQPMLLHAAAEAGQFRTTCAGSMAAGAGAPASALLSAGMAAMCGALVAPGAVSHIGKACLLLCTACPL